MNFTTRFGTTFNGELAVFKYNYDDSLCVELRDPLTEEVFVRFTVCIDHPGLTLADNESFIDTNNVPEAEEFLQENDLAKPTGKYGASGFCRYPLYAWNLEALGVTEEEAAIKKSKRELC